MKKIRKILNNIKICNSYSTLNESGIKDSTWKLPKIKSLYFDSISFTLDNFKNVVNFEFKPNTTYSILVKLRYDDGFFGMAGNQTSFVYKGIKQDKYIENFFYSLVDIINVFEDRYNAENINIIQIMYIVINDIPKLKIQNVNKIKLNKEFVNTKEIKEKYNSKFLPLTCDLNYYGKLLLKNEYLTLISKLNLDKSLGKNVLIDIKDIDLVYIYNNKLIIIKKLNTQTFSKEVYSVESGLFYYKAVDTSIDQNTFTRSISNTCFTISNGSIINVTNKKKLQPIKYYGKQYKSSANPYIGTLDLETFVDTDGISKVYALGFYTYIEEKRGVDPVTYFLQKNETFSELLINCFNNILSKMYNDYTFYTHNFGSFDSIFILKILTEYNIQVGFEYYKLKTTFRDNKLLKLVVSVKKLNDVTKKEQLYKISIVDSYNILNKKLSKLGDLFESNVTKGYFPYSFVKLNTLNYIGNTPSIDYWYNQYKDNISIEEYNNLYNTHWNLRYECINYLNRDLLSLYSIIKKFNNYIYEIYDTQMTDCLTISRLAMNIFIKDYLGDSKLPIVKKGMYNDIKNAYYGGVTEVYKPYGENLYYYDVNSLYPFSSKNAMCGTNCTYMEDLGNDGLKLYELFGFFYCEIETSNSYIGLLPVNCNIGLIMPMGKWKGWYFSEELKFAYENNYKIKVIKGYNFNKQYNVFDKYVDKLYDIKSNSTDPTKFITKSLLNNLLGRFGLNVNKPITRIVQFDELNLLLKTRKVNSLKTITDNHFLVTYYSDISSEICKDNNLDYSKVLTFKETNDIEKDREFNDVSLTTSAAITSYSRIFMSKVKLDIISNKGNIYYTDTDSIVSDIPLNKELTSMYNIGKFKLEHSVKKGYFISSKTYCLLLQNGASIIKAKGVDSKSLNLNHFELMYKGVNVKGLKQSTIINYEKGSVVINTNDKININHDSYRKREKIFKNTIWNDTKPLIYNI